MTKGLKRCPFCNQKASVLTEREDYRVVCGNCAASTGCFETAIEAVTAWNKRPIEDELDKKNGFLIGTCYDLHDLIDDFRAECDQKDFEIKRLRESLELIAKSNFYFARGEEDKQLRRVCEIAKDTLKGVKNET